MGTLKKLNSHMTLISPKPNIHTCLIIGPKFTDPGLTDKQNCTDTIIGPRVFKVFCAEC